MTSQQTLVLGTALGLKASSDCIMTSLTPPFSLSTLLPFCTTASVLFIFTSPGRRWRQKSLKMCSSLSMGLACIWRPMGGATGCLLLRGPMTSLGQLMTSKRRCFHSSSLPGNWSVSNGGGEFLFPGKFSSTIELMFVESEHKKVFFSIVLN